MRFNLFIYLFDKRDLIYYNFSLFKFKINI